MNTDFRLTIGFSSHPKIRRLKRRHGSDAVVSLIQLWEFTAQHRSEGVLTGMTEEDILDATGWHGDCELINSLVEFRLLDKGPEWYEIHNWRKNNPWAAEATRRSESARQAAQERWKKTKGESNV